MADALLAAPHGHQTPACMRLPRIWRKTCRTHSRSHISTYADPAVRSCSKRTSVRAQAGKGFGKTQEVQRKPADKREASGKQASKRRISKPQQDPQFRSQVPGGVQQNDDFESRLKGLQDQAAQRGTESQQQQQPPLATKDIYAQPPPLSQTLFGKKNKYTEKRENEAPPSYFNQTILTASSVILIGIFLVSCIALGFGGDTAPERPPVTQDLTADKKAQLQKAAKEFESQYASDPTNIQALEGAGVSYANLGDFKRAEGLLKSLTSATPNNPEAWRVLAEVRTKLKDNRGTAAAYEKAVELTSSLKALQSLVAAYIDDGQYQPAIDAIKSARQRLTSTPEELASLGYGETELDLLLGRAYAQWPGHDSQAMQYYDTLIRDKPDDFRGYLARGVLFRGQGRQGEAWRMFIQARGMAPKESKALVDRVIGPARGQ